MAEYETSSVPQRVRFVMSRIKRRDFLHYSAALGASPLLGTPTATAAVGADYDVVIIGAGMAGMAAARILSKAGPGLKVIILEARDRVGGRMYTEPDKRRELTPHGLELGAQFIHGSQAATWELIKELGISTYPRSELGEPSEYYFTPGGSSWRPDWQAKAALQKGLREAWQSYQGPDVSYQAFVESQSYSAEQQAELAAEAISWSAEPSQLSIAAAVQDGAKWDAWHDDDYQVVGGYSGLAENMAASLTGKIQLDSKVTEIYSNQGLSGIFYDYRGSKTALTARRVVVTLPVGVLQSDQVKLHPQLPEWKQHAIDSLQMGQVVVAKLMFAEHLWVDKIPAAGGWETPDGRISFSLPHPQGTGRAVSGWFSGSAAQQLSELGEEAALQQILSWLASASGTADLQPRLQWYRYKDWIADPYSKGSYSFTKPGGHGERSMLAKPIADVLFFAGEATAEPPHYQTVHGAYMSGKRVANEVALSLRTVATKISSEEAPLLEDYEEPILNPL